jgi:arsenate reductase
MPKRLNDTWRDYSLATRQGSTSPCSGDVPLDSRAGHPARLLIIGPVQCEVGGCERRLRGVDLRRGKTRGLRVKSVVANGGFAAGMPRTKTADPRSVRGTRLLTTQLRSSILTHFAVDDHPPASHNPVMKEKSVLIVCTGNSCRSQMAEALWRHEAGDRYEVVSAGTSPCGVHPIARLAIEELDIDMTGQYGKSVYDLAGRDWDLVVTVCDHAREVCPAFPRAKRKLHWPFPDPVLSEGSIEERLVVFRQVREAIQRRIREFLAAQSKSDST